MRFGRSAVAGIILNMGRSCGWNKGGFPWERDWAGIDLLSLGLKKWGQFIYNYTMYYSFLRIIQCFFIFLPVEPTHIVSQFSYSIWFLSLFLSSSFISLLRLQWIVLFFPVSSLAACLLRSWQASNVHSFPSVQQFL
jgi:hypothetical protein